MDTKENLWGSYLLLSTSSYIVNNQFVDALSQTKDSYTIMGNSYTYIFPLKMSILHVHLKKQYSRREVRNNNNKRDKHKVQIIV